MLPSLSKVGQKSMTKRAADSEAYELIKSREEGKRKNRARRCLKIKQ